VAKGQSASVDRLVALVDTDRLYFGINANGDDYYDWGHFKGSATLIPLPGAVWLLGSGLLGLIGVRRRLKG